MANKVRLKCVKSGRHNSKAGHRRRSKNKKSVVEKRRFRLSAQDNLLAENLHFQNNLNKRPNLGI